MSTLYIENPEVRVRLENSQLILENPTQKTTNGPIQKISLCRLDRVVLLGRAHITMPALTALMEADIPFCLHKRNGEFIGRVVPPLGGNVALRRAQYQLFEDSIKALPYAASTVKAKLCNQRRLLQRLRRNSSQPLPVCQSAINQIKFLEGKADLANSSDSLRGYEGAGARAYWKAVAELLQQVDINFPGRCYHPCTDAVNAMLSFGYTLLTSKMASSLESCGLDPYFGFFHTPEYNRLSLALDLIEPLRPVLVDRLVLKLFQRKQLGTMDFETQEEQCVHMKISARKIWYSTWEEQSTKCFLDKIIRKLSETLAKSLLHSEELWVPYYWRENE